MARLELDLAGLLAEFLLRRVDDDFYSLRPFRYAGREFRPAMHEELGGLGDDLVLVEPATGARWVVEIFPELCRTDPLPTSGGKATSGGGQ